MDINEIGKDKNLNKNVPQQNTLEKSNNEKNKITRFNDVQKNEANNTQQSTPKNNSKKDLYYNRKLTQKEVTPKRSKPKKDEGKTIALSDEEWENAGNPLGFEKLGTVRGKKKINVFTNLKEKELEEQIALLGAMDLNEVSACDDSYDATKKSSFPINKHPFSKNNQLFKVDDFKTDTLASFIGLMAKTFVEDYSKNKTEKISLVIYLSNN
ncbi:Hypothetical protein SRAE_1000172700 [Strongyloides ratti]|uniref:Uncharacterized protein n=1 Tax=Strongyloides ratti TaxID=34506 RepID=A0A090L101_STRRB|nr:Hypothetical protein SRAE_1000172700 [Strongyloides ratti]CEF63465.1 Hypothetical protein SRAE_1000172700 [Strongyloides ratti]